MEEKKCHMRESEEKIITRKDEMDARRFIEAAHELAKEIVTDRLGDCQNIGQFRYATSQLINLVHKDIFVMDGLGPVKDALISLLRFHRDVVIDAFPVTQQGEDVS